MEHRRLTALAVVCGMALLLGADCVAAQTSDRMPAGFRIVSLALMDPHLFLRPHGCSDALSGDLSVNVQINKQLNTDSDGDGNYDLSPVIAFQPLDPDAPGTTVELVFAGCTIPTQSPTVCSGAGAKRYRAAAVNMRTGECLGVLTGTTNSTYVGKINTPSAGCFATDSQTIVISLAGIELTLYDARIAAVYDGDPVAALTSGLIRGFVTEEDAEAVELKIPGAKSLAALLPGGRKNCARHSDQDICPGGAAGWYFYLNYTAVKTEWTE